MGKVVNIHAQAKKGEPAFVICGCTEEGTPMLVQAMTGDDPFVMGLLCPECGAYAPVISGYIQDPETA